MVFRYSSNIRYRVETSAEPLWVEDFRVSNERKKQTLFVSDSQKGTLTEQSAPDWVHWKFKARHSCRKKKTECRLKAESAGAAHSLVAVHATEPHWSAFGVDSTKIGCSFRRNLFSILAKWGIRSVSSESSLEDIVSKAMAGWSRSWNGAVTKQKKKQWPLLTVSEGADPWAREVRCLRRIPSLPFLSAGCPGTEYYSILNYSKRRVFSATRILS